ncbi:hypothetical protein ACFL6N_02510 [Thermodesulfobacteriota bacterium]
MLVIKCAACREKLFRYDKIGPGEVLRCHRSRIGKTYSAYESHGRLCCPCGKHIGIDKGSFFKMIAKAFTSSGKKRKA